uniref:Rho termination factor-like N-terminal domain-containing protein n=1 Tax=Rhizophora mucronata TaxID=61149 RepID=A0A2P2JNC1_RHIMU
MLAGPTKVREASKVKARQRGMPNSGQTPQNYAQHSADQKLTRPPSNFVKRTPIPSPSSPRGIAVQITSELSAATSISPALESPKLEEMKLPELKELAKSRGFRGYSKLKKCELLELLRS